MDSPGWDVSAPSLEGAELRPTADPSMRRSQFGVTKPTSPKSVSPEPFYRAPEPVVASLGPGRPRCWTLPGWRNIEYDAGGLGGRCTGCLGVERTSPRCHGR